MSHFGSISDDSNQTVTSDIYKSDFLNLGDIRTSDWCSLHNFYWFCKLCGGNIRTNRYSGLANTAVFCCVCEFVTILCAVKHNLKLLSFHRVDRFLSRYRFNSILRVFLRHRSTSSFFIDSTLVIYIVIYDITSSTSSP